jgi:hypothetical protein
MAISACFALPENKIVTPKNAILRL